MKIYGNRPLQVFLAVCLVPIAIIVIFKLLMLGDRPVQPITQETNVVVREKEQRLAPAIAFGHAAEASKHSEEEQKALDDSEARKKRAHSMSIAVFMRSPARDTPECRKLLSILLANGKSVEELPPLYDSLYQIRPFETNSTRPEAKINGEPVDITNTNHLRILNNLKEHSLIVIKNSLERAGYSSDVIEQTMSIRPTVFYGNIGMEINLSGARQDYTDSDLLKYIEDNPVMP